MSISGWLGSRRWAARLLALLALLAGKSAHAQAENPFSAVELSAAGVGNLSVYQLAEFWERGHGFIVRVASPFYFGRIGGSVHLADFEAVSTAQPDFGSRTFSLEWDAQVGRPEALQGHLGVQLGSMSMHFDEEEGVVAESELLLGGQAGLARRIGAGISVEGSLIHRKVLTHRPLHLTFVTAGLSYRHTMPRWIRALLE